MRRRKLNAGFEMQENEKDGGVGSDGLDVSLAKHEKISTDDVTTTISVISSVRCFLPYTF